MLADIPHCNGERTFRGVPGHSLDCECEPPLALARTKSVLSGPFLQSGPHVLVSISYEGYGRHCAVRPFYGLFSWSRLCAFYESQLISITVNESRDAEDWQPWRARRIDQMYEDESSEATSPAG